MNLTEYGQSSASRVAQNFCESWRRKSPIAKALILRGKHGVGKTSLVHACAETYKLELVETNSSSDRSKDTFNSLCNAAMTGGDKLVFFDEADGLTASMQKRLLKLLETTKCPVFIATNSKLEKELEQACMVVEVRPVKGEQSHRLTRMLALGGEKLEHSDDPEEQIVEALRGGSDDVPVGSWWMVNTWLLDNTKGSEPLAFDLFQARYRKVGKDMEKYAQRALKLGLKQVERPWSLKHRWGGPKKATAAKSKPAPKKEEKPKAPAPPKPSVVDSSTFF